MQNRKLGRNADHRKALLRNLATEVILKGKIETTEMKAKELTSVVDGLITIAKKNDLASKRQAAAYLMPVETKDGKSALKVLFEEVAPKCKDRKGGYTRVTKTYVRRGDAAPMATIELVDYTPKAKAKAAPKAKKEANSEEAPKETKAKKTTKAKSTKTTKAKKEKAE